MAHAPLSTQISRATGMRYAAAVADFGASDRTVDADACARIATERSDALDVFYVTEGDGLKLSDEMTEAVDGALIEKLARVNPVLAGPTPPTTTGRQLNEKNRSDYQTASAGRR